MKTLGFIFECPEKNRCVLKDDCIFNQSLRLSNRNDIPYVVYREERKKLVELYNSNCKKLIKDRNAREPLALEIFRREIENF